MTIPITGGGRFAFGLEEGQFLLDVEEIDGQWQNIVTYEIPDIFFNWDNIGYFDRYGNRITDVPWISMELYATGFSLWDYDHDGIPVILVYYWGNYFGTGDGGTPTVMFRFIDGEYRRVLSIPRWGQDLGFRYRWPSGFHPRYYFDGAGNIVMGTSGIDGDWYDYVIFEGNVATFNHIAITNSYWDEETARSVMTWHNFITGETNIPADFVYSRDSFCDCGFIWPPGDFDCSFWHTDHDAQRYLPGMDIPITRIEPLTELKESITANARLRLTRIPANNSVAPATSDTIPLTVVTMVFITIVSIALVRSKKNFQRK
jgi:hypothetical protein